MKTRTKSLLIATVGSLLCVASACGTQQRERVAPLSSRFDGSLSVLTYNIKGSAWPIAWGRPAAFAAMAGRLRALRRQHRNPQIVVLQEAFTDEARSIGRDAGYRYVVDGPSAEQVDPAPMTEADRNFAAGARWWLGEAHGKVVGSGLQLLSDYPVLRVRRMAYPGFACAGFDCLANKGALLVTVRIPGAPSPVDIVTTHLNSRRSSGVPDARSLYAYRRQAELFSAFVARWHDRAFPLIAAGDFNVGTASPRWAALRTQIAFWPDAASIRNAVGQVVTQAAAAGLPVDREVGAIMRRGTDWQFFAPGRRAGIRAVAISVPFGPDANGAMLSDHIGYVAHFRLDPLAQGLPARRQANARDGTSVPAG